MSVDDLAERYDFTARIAAMIRRRFVLVLSAVFAVLCFAPAAPARDPLGESGPVDVREAVDGDTVILADGRQVRLVGLQAPKLALGRKNYLFAGADSGGERAAVAYTVLAACRIHRREPWGYLRDVLTALAERDEDASVVDLLPDRFGPLLLGLPAG